MKMVELINLIKRRPDDPVSISVPLVPLLGEDPWESSYLELQEVEGEPTVVVLGDEGERYLSFYLWPGIVRDLEELFNPDQVLCVKALLIESQVRLGLAAVDASVSIIVVL